MGVIPVYNMAFHITPSGIETLKKYTPQEIEQKFISIAELETMTPSFDGNVEEWNPFEAGGWVRRLMTGKSVTLAMAGKRSVGDPGNDMIANLATETATKVLRTILIVFDNGDQLAFHAVVSTGQPFGGDTTNVSAIDFSLMSTDTPLYSAYGCVTVTALKIWDDDGRVGKRPEIWFKLFRTIGSTTEAVPGAHVTRVRHDLLTGTWGVTWRNVMEKNGQGTAYTFSVKEVDATGNDLVPDDYAKNEDGLTVTNTWLDLQGMMHTSSVDEPTNEPEIEEG